MTFGKRSGFFQPMPRYIAAGISSQNVTITRSLVNSSAVTFTFSNSNLPNANIIYTMIGVETTDFTDGIITGVIQLNSSGNATVTKNLTTSSNIGIDKSFYATASTFNNRVTGTSANVNILSETPFVATGGNTITANGNVTHVFTSNGNLVVTQLYSGANANIGIRSLIVAQGGSAGGISSNAEGGGGAGGLIHSNINANTFTVTTYPIVVGNSSISGNGENSSFKGLIAIGGGAGASSNIAGNIGGSGGGGSGKSTIPTYTSAGGAGTSGQGFAGGSGSTTGPSGGGGGGASQVGNPRTGNPNTSCVGGNGSIIAWAPVGYGDTTPGYAKYFAGGGSGEGAGTYAPGSSGNNTGGGGHAIGSGLRLGRSGIVMISYPTFTGSRYLNLP